MARISSSAVAILFYQLLLQSTATSTSTSIIDANGVFNTRADISNNNKGIVAIISSPGTKSYFDNENNESDEAGEGEGEGEGGVTLNDNILSSPGATLSGTASLSKGNGAAAAASVAGSIIVSGITESDLEYGLHGSRHEKTLASIFKAKLDTMADATTTAAASAAADASATDEEGEGEGEGGEEGESEGGEGEEKDEIKPTKLFLVMPPCDADAEVIKEDVEKIFEAALAEKNLDGVSFDDIFETNIVDIDNEDEAKEVLALASEAAAEVPQPTDILSSIAKAYSSVTTSSESSSSAAASSSSSSATAAILACDDSFARHNRAVRAKLASWKSRTSRGLTVDNFGSASTTLMEKSMEAYDRDTLIAAGACDTTAASYRLEVRSKLQSKVENGIRELFKVQVDILEKATLKKFNAMLLRQHGKGNEGTEQYYNDNAAAMRAAAFSFETAVGDLEVASLSLTKAKAVADIDMKLGTALNDFPDSPAARLKNMKEVTRAANKQKKPTERSIDLGLDLVAMIRPDGFGNLQGFAGYQLGGNNIIVGVHNDADAPDVISQFGGKRPPFIRVQPKLKVDVEL